jgi:hypothetical protein
MISSAPTYYHDSQVYQIIQSSVCTELERIGASVEDIRTQRNVATATWGLDLWEAQLGLVATDKDNYPLRRSDILGRLRGIGNFSADLARVIAETYTNAAVAISVSIPDYVFTVTFTGTHGTPIMLPSIQAAIEDIKHAHLGVAYVYTYTIWNHLDRYNKTFDELDAMGLTWDEFDRLYLEMYAGHYNSMPGVSGTI